MTPEEIQERLAAIHDRLGEIAERFDAINTEAGDARLEGDAAEEWRSLETEFDELEAEEAELRARAERLRKVAEFANRPGHTEPGDGAIPTVNVNRNEDPFDLSNLRFGASGDEIRAQARAALAKVEHLDDTARTNVERLMARADAKGALARHIIVTGKSAYRSAFAKVMQAMGGPADLTPDEAQAWAEARAMSLSAGSGGYAVPFTLDPTVIDTAEHSVNPFRQISQVSQIVTDTWHGVASGGVTANWRDEADETSDDSPTLTQPSIPVHRADAFVPFSFEIGMDWAGMEAELRGEIARARDDLEATAHAVGNGVNKPTGVVTALVAGNRIVPSATTDTFAVGDLYKVEESLAARFRTRARWVANKAIFNDVRQFGTSEGNLLWERLRDGQPPQLLGYPTHEASAMDGAIDTSADNYVLVFGDFAGYRIVDRVGMSIELVPHLFGPNRRPTGQRGWLAFWRTGADVVNDTALLVLNVT